MSSVGVLEDKSSSSIVEGNFEVLGLGFEACVLDSITGDNVLVLISMPVHTHTHTRRRQARSRT